mgnify:CR=1 FL=1
MRDSLSRSPRSDLSVTVTVASMTGSSGPTYPGIIPYHTDPPSPQTLGPRLIGVEQRPDSVTGSYGPPSAQVTVTV